MSAKESLPAADIPEIIFDAERGYADFYRRAWELAWDHVIEYSGAPRSPYMDEAHTPGRIWIWDTCFMALFCKYAPDRFPGVESFDNFYKPLYDGAPSALGIHHLDNPPLFAWIEWENYLFTGNRARLEEIYHRGYLQKHFELMESLPLAEAPACATNETFFRKVEKGYHWAGCPNGMDNTPRGGGGGGGESRRCTQRVSEHSLARRNRPAGARGRRANPPDAQTDPAPDNSEQPTHPGRCEHLLAHERHSRGGRRRWQPLLRWRRRGSSRRGWLPRGPGA